MIAWSQRIAWKWRNDKNSVLSETPLENARLLQATDALDWCHVFIGWKYCGSIGFIWHFNSTLPNTEYTCYTTSISGRERPWACFIISLPMFILQRRPNQDQAAAWPDAMHSEHDLRGGACTGSYGGGACIARWRRPTQAVEAMWAKPSGMTWSSAWSDLTRQWRNTLSIDMLED
jgi:hypothetical protein